MQLGLPGLEAPCKSGIFCAWGQIGCAMRALTASVTPENAAPVRVLLRPVFAHRTRVSICVGGRTSVVAGPSQSAAPLLTRLTRPDLASHRRTLLSAEAFEPPRVQGLAGYDCATATLRAEDGGVAVAIGDRPQPRTRGAANDRHLFGPSPCPAFTTTTSRRLTLSTLS